MDSLAKELYQSAVFPAEKKVNIYKYIKKCEEKDIDTTLLLATDIKSPAVTCTLSCIFGFIGLDRLYISDYAFFFLKIIFTIVSILSSIFLSFFSLIITLPYLIFVIIDIFICQNRCKLYNYNSLLQQINLALQLGKIKDDKNNESKEQEEYEIEEKLKSKTTLE